MTLRRGGGRQEGINFLLHLLPSTVPGRASAGRARKKVFFRPRQLSQLQTKSP